jgi:hypothetical protein
MDLESDPDSQVCYGRWPQTAIHGVALSDVAESAVFVRRESLSHGRRSVWAAWFGLRAVSARIGPAMRRYVDRSGCFQCDCYRRLRVDPSIRAERLRCDLKRRLRVRAEGAAKKKRVVAGGRL